MWRRARGLLSRWPEFSTRRPCASWWPEQLEARVLRRCLRASACHAGGRHHSLVNQGRRRRCRARLAGFCLLLRLRAWHRLPRSTPLHWQPRAAAFLEACCVQNLGLGNAQTCPFVPLRTLFSAPTSTRTCAASLRSARLLPSTPPAAQPRPPFAARSRGPAPPSLSRLCCLRACRLQTSRAEGHAGEGPQSGFGGLAIAYCGVCVQAVGRGQCRSALPHAAGICSKAAPLAWLLRVHAAARAHATSFVRRELFQASRRCSLPPLLAAAPAVLTDVLHHLQVVLKLLRRGKVCFRLGVAACRGAAGGTSREEQHARVEGRASASPLPGAGVPE